MPEEIFADLYIVEIIVAGHQWLTQQDAELAAHYKRQADQLIIDIELAAAAKTTVFAGVKEMLSGLREQQIKLGIVTRNCRAAIDVVFPQHPLYVDALHARDDVRHQNLTRGICKTTSWHWAPKQPTVSWWVTAHWTCAQGAS